MKKENIYKFLFLISGLLVFGFIIRLVVDYIKYDPIITSAPFYTYIIIRAIEFLVAAIILFVVALVLRKKWHKK